MFIKTLLPALALCAFAVGVRGAEARPVLVVVAPNIGAKSGDQGTQGVLMAGIGAWANHYVNKQSAERVARFIAASGQMNLSAEASRVFGCFGVPEGCNQSAFTNSDEFAAALAARADKAGVVIELTPELVADEFLMRAASHVVALSEQKKKGKNTGPVLEQRATNLAVFDTRPLHDGAAPPETPAELERYWLSGEPRRIVGDALRGLTALNSLLGMLASDGGTPGKMPPAWKQLPKVGEFKASGRITCVGSGVCSGIHVLKDEGDHFILVCCGNAAGWYDAAAAANNSNLNMNASMGILKR